MDIPAPILQWLAELSGTLAICLIVLVFFIFLGHWIGGILEDRIP